MGEAVPGLLDASHDTRLYRRISDIWYRERVHSLLNTHCLTKRERRCTLSEMRSGEAVRNVCARTGWKHNHFVLWYCGDGGFNCKLKGRNGVLCQILVENADGDYRF